MQITTEGLLPGRDGLTKSFFIFPCFYYIEFNQKNLVGKLPPFFLFLQIASFFPEGAGRQRREGGKDVAEICQGDLIF